MSTLGKIVDRWVTFAIWVRLVLALAFIPIMAFGIVVFPEARLIATIALVALSAIAAHAIRSLKVERTYARGRSEVSLAATHMDDEGGALEDLRGQFVQTWRVHAAVVVAQVGGVFVGWRMFSLHGLVGIFAIGAMASVLGFCLGLLWDRQSRKASWARCSRYFRFAYIACVLTLTFAGVLVAVCGRVLAYPHV